MSFPRTNLFDRDGIAVIGMPIRLKNATAEYSVRAAETGIVLAPDPTIDQFGGVVDGIREKVGPIETETTYSTGSSTGSRLPMYPGADRWISDYLLDTSTVIR